MKNKNQDGFSLIELLIVFVIIGILTVITFPYLQRAKGTAENGNAFATMKTILSAQYSFYSQNSRYARLDELNNSQYGGLGATSGNMLVRGNFTFLMSPENPTDEDLRDGFTVMATRPAYAGESPVVITVTERGHAASLFD